GLTIFGTGPSTIRARLSDLQGYGALYAAMRLLEGQRDFRFDILTAHREAGTPASGPASATEQALEKIAKSAPTPAPAEYVADVAEIAILDVHAFPARRRPELFTRFPVRPEGIVFLAFVSIGKNFVCLV